MKYQKGEGGRPKGAVNQKTKDWERLGEYMIGAGADRFAEAMQNCDEDDFMKYYAMMLEYFKPKQQRTTISGDSENPLAVDLTNLSTDELKLIVQALNKVDK